MRGGKSGSRSPKAGQRGRLRAAALSVWFSVLFLLSFSWCVLGWRRAQRTALVYAKHTPPNPTSVEH